MLRRVLNWLGIRDGGDAESEDRTGEGSEESDDDGFIPSRLDASVLESHGMETTEAERELESIEEKARILESSRPDEHPDDHER
jgi:hypothetical protein